MHLSHAVSRDFVAVKEFALWHILTCIRTQVLLPYLLTFILISFSKLCNVVHIHANDQVQPLMMNVELISEMANCIAVLLQYEIIC